MRVYLTGDVCLESGARLIAQAQLPRRQGRLAFVFLVAERRRAVARDELAELLWPARLPPAWAVALSSLVSKLRGLLSRAEPAAGIRSAFGCYQLRLPPGAWVDTEAALEAVHEAEAALRAGAPERAYGPAVVAGTILRRPFLAGAEGAWVEARREQLRAHLLRALDCLIDVHLWNREPALARQVAEESVRLEPFRETGHQRLMRA
ncbi:MAG TPA: BTAD domain-containing putative transcriptional regulator, partial [Candidatus Acidoferrales bacterium]|nr:BTAD domain-containing putative transcriptional regulator [Candidatus Acidoferrales bacterium]